MFRRLIQINDKAILTEFLNLHISFTIILLSKVSRHTVCEPPVQASGSRNSIETSEANRCESPHFKQLKTVQKGQ
jgi:hypothetical protein